jgi:hypothetical protein
MLYRGVWLTLAIFALSTLAAVPNVHADAGAMLPILVEQADAKVDRLEVEQAARRYFALLPEPIPVTASEDALRRAGARFRSCGEPGCASEYARALGIDLAIAVRLFAPDREAPFGSLSAALVTSEGTAFTGGVRVDERGLADATVRALGLAYERWRRGPGPWLSVDGPHGSRVRVDQGPLAIVPYTERHEPGLHQLRVEDEAGNAIYSAALQLPDDPNHHERVHVKPIAREPMAASEPMAAGAPVAAQPPPAAPLPPSYWQRKRSVWNYVLGVPIALAGVFYTSVGIAQFHARGDCSEHAGGTCTRRKTVNAGSRAALALGLTGVAVGGGLFLGAGVVRTPDAPRDAAFMFVTGRF